MADLFRTAINFISILAIPLMIATFLVWGFFKKVRVYEVFVEGAKDGFHTAIRIIPYLVRYRNLPCKRCNGCINIDHHTAHESHRYAAGCFTDGTDASAFRQRFFRYYDRIDESARTGFVYRCTCLNAVRQFGNNILYSRCLLRICKY